MKEGEIYAPEWSNKDCKHYVVCMEDCKSHAEFFRACLISHMKTSTKNEIKNQQMDETWFESTNPATNKKYKIQFDNSQLVCQPILKAQYKINLRRGVIGKLSKFGISECKKYTQEIVPIYSNKPINQEHPKREKRQTQS